MARLEAPLSFLQQGSPSNPPAGRTLLFAKTSDRLYLRSSAGVERPVEAGLIFPFSRAGVLTTGAGTFRLYNDTGDTLTIKAVRSSVGTVPTGAAILVDINISGTTIFTTQANRPSIAVSTNTSGKITNMDVTSIADGSYFTVDIDQIGSTIAGSDLTVQILC